MAGDNSGRLKKASAVTFRIIMKPDINAIKARLGSISKTKMEKLPLAIQVLLTKDLPELLKTVVPSMDAKKLHSNT